MAKDTATLTLDRYASDARAWVAAAQQLADERGHAEVSGLHLLACGVERDPGIAAVLQSAGVVPAQLQVALEQALQTLTPGTGPSYLSRDFLDLLRFAESNARSTGSGRVAGTAAEISVEDLLDALTHSPRGPLAEVLATFRLGRGSLRGFMGALRTVPRPVQSGPTPTTLGELVKDLLEAARQRELDPVIGRAKEIRRALTILERRSKCHPLLVGETGTGRGAVVRGIAARIASSDVPTSLAETRLLEVDVGALLEGARLRGEVQARLRKLVSASQQRRGQPVIFAFRSIERLLAGGSAGPASGDLLSSFLAGGRMRLLATTTPEGLRRIQSGDPALAAQLTVLPVEEPNVEETAAILRGIMPQLELHHGVSISETAITTAAALSKRYLAERFLPDSALDLLDESAAARRVETDGLTSQVEAEMSQLTSLRAQLSSLANVPDESSRRKATELKQRVDELQPRVEAQREVVERRRGTIAAFRQLSRELNAVRVQRDRAARERDFARLGELEHAVLPDLEAKLERAEGEVRRAGFETGKAIVEDTHVAQTLAQWTGVPVAKMLEGEAEKLLGMEARLAQRVVGQPHAVKAIAQAIRRGRVGLRDPRRPIGSFLFLGTSGVGKTELAKAVAEFLFDDEHALTRLDMSEFMERHMAQRLVGAPPGYADSDQGGFLTEAVRKRPYSVLLFDEVEKAHQDVFNLLLQVLDDGRLTDGRGRLADFTNTVVIMTSNIGSQEIGQAEAQAFQTQLGRDSLKQRLFDNLGEFFRPEFLNRIGDIVLFRPLSREDLRAIIEIQIRNLQHLLSHRDLTLVVSDEAKDRLVELGYDPALGARPLQRVLVREVQDPLAEALLGGAFPEGQRIVVGHHGVGFTFSPEAPAAVESPPLRVEGVPAKPPDPAAG
jgi:ATP-dependent Clp protease ATP-binding subunit ClpB